MRRVGVALLAKLVAPPPLMTALGSGAALLVKDQRRPRSIQRLHCRKQACFAAVFLPPRGRPTAPCSFLRRWNDFARTGIDARRSAVDMLTWLVTEAIVTVRDRIGH